MFLSLLQSTRKISVIFRRLVVVLCTLGILSSCSQTQETAPRPPKWYTMKRTGISFKNRLPLTFLRAFPHITRQTLKAVTGYSLGIKTKANISFLLKPLVAINWLPKLRVKLSLRLGKKQIIITPTILEHKTLRTLLLLIAGRSHLFSQAFLPLL